MVRPRAVLSIPGGNSSVHKYWFRSLLRAAVLLWFCLITFQLGAREKDTLQYGSGLIVNVPFPESEVVQVVQEVVQNGIIRGTKEYNKDEFISGATAETSARPFPAWTEVGKVFYKMRTHAIGPRNFKDSGDVGTLAVRYVVQSQDDKNTVLRIDALFVEDFRKTVHPSNGSVESAEYKDIHDRLDAIEVMKAQAAEAQKEQQERRSAMSRSAGADDPLAAGTRIAAAPAESHESAPSTPLSAPAATPQTLEQHVRELRQQVERLVKAPGAPLKSAPFHTASTLRSLPAGTGVLIVISTPYWFGVETRDGQHGWILRDQLEQIR